MYPNSHNVNDTIVPYAAWKDIPSTYVMAENDRALYFPVQQWVISSCQLPSEVLRLESGHCQVLSMPDRTAAIIRRAAGEQGVDMEGVKFGMVETDTNRKPGWEE